MMKLISGMTLDLHRHIGGLESADKFYIAPPSLHRHIGGLEKKIVSSFERLYSSPPHRRLRNLRFARW